MGKPNTWPVWAAAGFFIGLSDLLESMKKSNRSQDLGDLEVLEDGGILSYWGSIQSC